MLTNVKNDLITWARKLPAPYEKYSINELADHYCIASDADDEYKKNIYISALVLRFWYTIDKMYRSNTAASLDYLDFYGWLYEAIEYACKYRGWQDPNKKLNAQQCINKCIATIKLQKYYNLRLDKHKAVNYCCSLDVPVGGANDKSNKSLADTLEDPEYIEDTYERDAIILDTQSLIQGYLDEDKLIEAILIDNIAFNDTRKHFKRTVKVTNENNEQVRYTEYSSQFWAYRLIQIVSKLPATYKDYFLAKYKVSEKKLTAILDVIGKANNQKLYRYLAKTLKELRSVYA